MGQSISSTSRILEPKNDVLLTTRSDPPPGHSVKQEFGVVMARDISSWEKTGSGDDGFDDIFDEATKLASETCAERGGNALLATQFTVLKGNYQSNQYRDAIQVIGTCVKVEKKKR